MKLYLAGPMRGYTLYNFAAFFRAAAILRQAGHEIENPAEHDMAQGFKPHLELDDSGQPRAFKIDELLRADFKLILDCDGLALLPGWEGSAGARAERFVAECSGRKVFLFEGESRDDWTLTEQDPLGVIELPTQLFR